MKAQLAGVFPLILLFATLVGCRENRTDYAVLLKAKIPVGTSADKVEAVLKQVKAEYSFDQNGNAYHAIIRGTGASGGFVIEDTSVTILLDDRRQVKELSVKKVYTGP